jgi:hypothetical protein
LTRICPDTEPLGFLTRGDNEKTPLLSKFGGPNVTVPLKGVESFMLTVKFATGEPFVVVSGIDGVLGVTAIVAERGVGLGVGVGVGSGTPGGGELPVKANPFQIHQPFAIVLA